jgi:hypothetical protein
MRYSPRRDGTRLRRLRQKSLAVVLICTINMSGCHNGSMRSVQRPKIFTNPFRRQPIVTTPGYTTVESPGAVIVNQQEQAAGVGGSVSAGGGLYAEPPATQLEARPNAGAVTTVVPSFEDAQKPLGSGSGSYSENQNYQRGFRDSLAPPAEAPQVIMEAPPVGDLQRKPSTNPSLDSSATQAGGSQKKEEPRLEYLEPRRPSGNGNPPSSGSDGSSGSGASSPIGSKPSAWNRTPRNDEFNGRTTYQASSRRTIEAPEAQIGILD